MSTLTSRSKRSLRGKCGLFIKESDALLTRLGCNVDRIASDRQRLWLLSKLFGIKADWHCTERRALVELWPAVLAWIATVSSEGALRDHVASRVKEFRFELGGFWDHRKQTMRTTTPNVVDSKVVVDLAAYRMMRSLR